MICRFCKFDNADASAFCMGCGENLMERPVKRKGQAARSAGRTIFRLGIAIVLTAIAGAAVLAIVLEWEHRQKVEVESEAAVMPDIPAPANSAIAETRKPAPRMSVPRASVSSSARLESGSLEDWARASHAVRLTYAANFVTSRVALRSAEEVKNAAVRLENCISAVANEGISRTTRASQAASHCLPEIAR